MKQKLNRTNFPVSGSYTKSGSPGYSVIVISDIFKHTRKMYQCLSDLSSHNMLHRSVRRISARKQLQGTVLAVLYNREVLHF